MQKEKTKKNECPTCGHQNDIYTLFCVECGRILEKPDSIVKICPECSFANSVYSMHCTQCNKSLGGVKGQLESSQTASFHKLHTDKTSTDMPVIVMPLLQTSLTKSKPNYVIKLLMVIIALLAIGALLFALLPRFLGGGASSLNGLGEFKAQNGELIGVNDGSLSPFVMGNDGQLKQQAADQLKQGHNSQAIALWQTALSIQNNDAEAWIYLENQHVLLSGSPYLTLVAGTDLFKASGSGQSDLQGIYVAQHEFNTGNHGFRMRILIANSGTNINNVPVVARQIVNIANRDKTIIGVISWLNSNENITALPILSSAYIPMISPTASSDHLTNISPYFFRIVPPTQTQGRAAALFAEQTLHTQKAIVFIDKNDPYSQSLAQAFEEQFKQDKRVILKEEPFITDRTSKISDLIRDALNTHPDLLYFTSSDTSDTANFQDALPTSGPFAQVPTLSDDAGYVIHRAGYGHWYFTAFAFAFAFADKLNNIAGNPSSQSPFYQDYSGDFNSYSLKPAGYYGYTRPDDISMLSYDVTAVFLNAMNKTIATNKITLTINGLQQITPVLLANALTHIALQGVTGEIVFDSNHNPVNKTILFLASSPDGHTYMKDWQGCFTKDLCRNIK